MCTRAYPGPRLVLCISGPPSHLDEVTLHQRAKPGRRDTWSGEKECLRIEDPRSHGLMQLEYIAFALGEGHQPFGRDISGKSGPCRRARGHRRFLHRRLGGAGRRSRRPPGIRQRRRPRCVFATAAGLISADCKQDNANDRGGADQHAAAGRSSWAALAASFAGGRRWSLAVDVQPRIRLAAMLAEAIRRANRVTAIAARE